MITSIIQHLRFPFSILLLPVFLFALNEIDINKIHVLNAILLFFILHFIVYPSSNAYNSLQDKDKGSIGLIKNPLPIPKGLNILTIAFDIIAILISLYINLNTCLGVAIYILFSRLYSYRPIRFKKYPILGFLTVFIFQGFWIYILVQYTVGDIALGDSFPLAICASCLIGAIYPLSQIYQHQQDRADGVISISYLLGFRGTFFFSGILFLLGTFIFTSIHLMEDKLLEVLIFMIFQIPVVAFFMYWFYKVWHNVSEANYKNTMRMNILSAVCMNSCFITLYFFS